MDGRRDRRGARSSAIRERASPLPGDTDRQGHDGARHQCIRGRRRQHRDTGRQACIPVERWDSAAAGNAGWRQLGSDRNKRSPRSRRQRRDHFKRNACVPVASWRDAGPRGAAGPSHELRGRGGQLRPGRRHLLRRRHEFCPSGLPARRAVDDRPGHAGRQGQSCDRDQRLGTGRRRRKRWQLPEGVPVRQRRNGSHRCWRGVPRTAAQWRSMQTVTSRDTRTTFR